MHVIRRKVSTSWSAEQEVFDYLQDFSHAEEWDSGTVSCRRLDGDGGVGTRYLNVSRFLGRESELEYEVEEHDPPRKFVVTGRNKTLTSRDIVSIAPQPDGTTLVDYRAEMEFNGVVRLVSPLLTPFLAKLGDDTAAQLRSVLDAKAVA